MTGASPTDSPAAAAGKGSVDSRGKKEETPRPLLQALVPKDWRNFTTAVAFLLFGVAVMAFLPDVKLLIKRVLNMESLQTPEECVANLMLYEPLKLSRQDPYIERKSLFPPLSAAPFQHWDGPKTIGKSTEAQHLALAEKAKGNPVLYLSYKDLDGVKALGACFDPKTSPAPNRLNDDRQVAIKDALGMFRNAGYVRSGVSRWWYRLFPWGDHPYAGDGLPLLIIDDVNLATQEDARRWTVLGREGKFGRSYRTIILTSPGPSRTNVQLVSDIKTARRVTFRDFTWHETQHLLHDLDITDERHICEIWHVVGGRPGDLASVNDSLTSATLATHGIERWRRILIKTAATSYGNTLKRLPEKLHADMRTMCKTLAELLADDSSGDRCISSSELAEACGIDDAKPEEYWDGVLDEVINAGSVLWLQDGLCVQFESKPMRDFAASVLAKLPLANLTTVQCPRATTDSVQRSNLPDSVACEP